MAIAEHGIGATKVTNIGIFIWAIGTLFYSFEMLIKSSVSSMSGILQQSLQPNAVELALIGSIFYIMYVIMQIPAGLLSDKFGIKKSLSFASLVCAIGTLMFTFSSDLYMFIFARALMGIGGAFAFISGMKLAGQWFPARMFPLMAGLTQLLGYLGGAMAGQPLSAIVTKDSWHSVFLVIAIIGFVLSLLSFVFVKRRMRTDISGEPISTMPTLKETCIQLLSLLKDFQVLLNAFYCFAIVGVAFALTDLWGKQYLMNVLHVSENVAALATTSLIFIGIALSSPFWGMMATAIGSNKILLIVGTFIGLIASIFLLYIPIPIWLLYVFGFLIGVAQASHVLNFDVIKKLVKPQFLGTAIAFLNMFGIAGAAVTQLIIGFIIDHITKPPFYEHSAFDYKIALLIIPILFAISLIIACMLKDKKEVDIHFEHHES